ncbi:MAG: hypothetical protein HYT97_04430 [Elusimicrobia bacterium]|nr:hypothetical protein [Elusimicrobiota bacterium]
MKTIWSTIILMVLCNPIMGENIFPKLEALGIDEKTNYIIGIPKSRTDSNESNTVRKTLSKMDVDKNKLIITRIDGKFYWTSRENRQLDHNVSGVYDYFYLPDGAGYIKACKMNNKLVYMEHVHTGLSIITYWGELELK